MAYVYFVSNSTVIIKPLNKGHLGMGDLIVLCTGVQQLCIARNCRRVSRERFPGVYAMWGEVVHSQS